jgi:hypothetical protein
MPEVMSMPMMAAPVPRSEPMSDMDKDKMREAAKGLLSQLQDLDFNKVESFDLKIVMSGDADDMEDLADAIEDVEVEDNSENVADISSDKDLEKKDDEDN